MYDLCKKYCDGDWKTQKTFLLHQFPGDENIPSTVFNRKLALYKAGKLEDDSDQKRARGRKFQAVEDALIELGRSPLPKIPYKKSLIASPRIPYMASKMPHAKIGGNPARKSLITRESLIKNPL